MALYGCIFALTLQMAMLALSSVLLDACSGWFQA